MGENHTPVATPFMTDESPQGTDCFGVHFELPHCMHVLALLPTPEDFFVSPAPIMFTPVGEDFKVFMENDIKGLS